MNPILPIKESVTQIADVQNSPDNRHIPIRYAFVTAAAANNM